mmetsp:Transcript_26391/g.40856  ORF Transcript_26391/g.40856 Transcript_26391/m.40856 type:complete len:491 (-) Transcript_26391:129-1601(-)
MNGRPNVKVTLLLAWSICSIVRINGAEQSQHRNELWTPRLFTPLQLESLQNSHAIHHELATSGVIRIVNDGYNAENDYINCDSMAAALIQNVEFAIAHGSGGRSDDISSSRLRNRNTASARSLILDGITSETTTTKTDHIHDNEMELSRKAEDPTSPTLLLAQHDGVLISISSFVPVHHDVDYEPHRVLQLKLPSGAVVDVEMGHYTNEVVVMVGTQWSTRYSDESGVVGLHAPSYGMTMMRHSFLEMRRYYTKSSSTSMQQQDSKITAHNPSFSSSPSRLVSRTTKSIGEGRTATVVAHSHMDAKTHSSAFMDMDDMDMDDDDSKFCSGMGMDMNMEGFGASLGDSDRSCLNLYFESWTLDSNGKFVAAMFGVLLLGIFAEWLPRYKRRLYGKMKPDAFRLGVMSALHMTQLSIGYACMLAAMTYSVELFICLVTGLTIGFTLFMQKDEVPPLNADPCCVPEPTLSTSNTPLPSEERSPLLESAEQHID